jgi:hypothetical protein
MGVYMIEVYGKAPVVGYTVTIEDAKTDYEVYKLLYAATSNGSTMTKEQLERFKDLTNIFDKSASEKDYPHRKLTSDVFRK